MNALDTAMFWIEYVIRNKGAEYMKNPARNMSWIAYNMLDVYIFVLLILIGVILICTYMLKIVFSLVTYKVHVTKDKKYL